LGWHVVRVDSVTRKPARSLDQVRGEITTQLTEKLRRDALTDLTSRIEDQLDGGGNLADVAGELGVTPAITPPLTADGQVFGRPGQAAPAELARVLPTAFLMEREGQAQLAEIEAGKRFVVFEAAEIVPAAPPPLAQIRPRVAADWALAQGAAAARATADKAIAALGRGMPLAEALRASGAGSAQVQSIDSTRPQLMAAGRVPPPLALMFSMAERTTKRLEAPGNAGWFVVRLDDIEPGKVAPNDPLVGSVQRELGGLIGREYAEQFRRALRSEVGVKRNPAALRTVRERLVGSGN
jgi:peptidyl-prolyl cis-trans isomerase D